MVRLRETDGTEPHIRTLQYYLRECQKKKHEPFFLLLHQEASKPLEELKAKSQEVEKSSELLLDLMADIDGAELRLEDEVRNTSDDVSKLERQQSLPGLHTKIFPQSVGGVINPERQKQLPAVKALLQRLSPYLQHSEIKQASESLQERYSAMEEALNIRKREEERYRDLFTQEQSLRTTAREQLNRAYGQLATKYSADPSRVEAFFIANPRVGSTVAANAETRGRIAGKIEALYLFLDSKLWILLEEQKKKVLASSEEEVEGYLRRAYDGFSLTEILTIPPTEPSTPQ